MQTYNKVVSDEEIKNILRTVGDLHPEIFTTNSFNENIHESLQYLRYFPFSYIDVSGECLELVLLSSVNGYDAYGGDIWHVDGEEDETSVLLYLQGNNESGGEFCTEEKTYKFEVGTFFKLRSCELHKVEPYNDKLARIAIKWKFRKV